MTAFEIRRLGPVAGVLLFAAGLAACEPPPSHEAEIIDPAAQSPVAPEIEADAAPDDAAPPPDAAEPPPRERTSEQSVRPESETLFF